MSENLDALRGSIKKWENIRDNGGVDEGMGNCPLCQLYYEIEEGDCINCPVFKQTGRFGCLNTPYELWEDHQEEYHAEDWRKGIRKAICPTCITIANDEVSFLTQLLEKEEKKVSPNPEKLEIKLARAISQSRPQEESVVSYNQWYRTTVILGDCLSKDKDLGFNYHLYRNEISRLELEGKEPKTC